MPRLTLYLDTFPGMDPRCAYASAAPSSPPSRVPGYTRYAITVDVPDWNEPDARLPAELREVGAEQGE